MSIFAVSNVAQLKTALAAAGSGDTIQLAPGQYSGVALSKVNSGAAVTITSADPLHQAVLTDLSLKNSSGLVFSDLEFAVDPNKRPGSFSVYTSSNVVFDQLQMHGTLNGSPIDDKSGLLIRESSYVMVSNSDFEELRIGLTYCDSNHVTISGNDFHEIGVDGVDGGGTSNLTIANNSFYDFIHSGSQHPDAIQVWTTGTSASAHDIVISGNVINALEGSMVQGIFMRDTVNLPFQHVSISGNVVLGACYNGLYVDGASDLAITNNTVLGTTWQKSWIAALDSSGVTVTDNIATDYVLNDPSIVHSGNVLAMAMDQGTVADVAGWLHGQRFLGHEITQVDGFLYGHVDMLGIYDSAPGSDLLDQLHFQAVTINGTDAGETLTAGQIGTYIVNGCGGNDVLVGLTTGFDQLNGGVGDDTYLVKSASTLVHEDPGSGTDTVCAYLSYTLTDNVEQLRMMVAGTTGTGNDLANRVSGSAGDDTVFGLGGNDILLGNAGNDVLHSGSGSDSLSGGDGNDVLFGEGSADTLLGGAGSDTLYGGTGSNILEGDAGSDQIVAGSGANVFLYRDGDVQVGNCTDMDHIIGFQSGRDKISLSSIDANIIAPGNNAFTLIGSSAFHDVAGELRYQVDGTGLTIMGDVNGDGVADIRIHLDGVTTLAAGDVIG